MLRKMMQRLRRGTGWMALVCAASLSAHAQSGPNIEALLQQGNTAMRNGDFAQAADAFRQVTQTEPGFAEGYLNLGLALEQMRRYAESADALNRARALKPTLRGVNLFLGIDEYRADRLPDAERALIREIQGEPRNAMGWMWLGVVQLAENKPEAAADSLDHAASIDPKNTDIEYHRGRAHLLVSKKSYQQMYEADPKSWRVQEVLGQADAEAFRTEEAIRELKRAVELAPREPGLHEELGDVEWTAGKLEDADAAYAAELEADPENPMVLYKLGALRVTRDQAGTGIELLGKALAHDPTLTDAHYYLGKGEMASGQLQAAVEQLQTAADKSDDETLKMMSWYQLSAAYRQLHESALAAKAMAMFRQMKETKDRRQQQKFDDAAERQKLPITETVPTGDVPPGL